MNNYTNFYKHVEKLNKDIYTEEYSKHHSSAAFDVVEEFCQELDFDSAVELGCGTAQILDALQKMGKKELLGVTFLDEETKHHIAREDVHFNTLKDKSYDLVIARHMLEHSYMPLILLMEMRRIAKKYALVVVPTPTQRMIRWQNHYSVLTDEMWRRLFELSQWEVLKFERKSYYFEPDKNIVDSEYRYLLKGI